MTLSLQVVEAKEAFVDPVFRDRVLSNIVNDVVKTGRMVSLSD